MVGTTGLGDDDLADMARHFDGTRANAVFAANFATGAVLLMRFCELAAPFMESVEVIELHHNQKIDAPSGTALHTVEGIDAARKAAGAGPGPPTRPQTRSLAGARGAQGAGRGARSTRCASRASWPTRRSSSAAEGQSLTIRHDAYDRRSFMAGVLLAVRTVGDRPGLTVGLAPLLGL